MSRIQMGVDPADSSPGPERLGVRVVLTLAGDRVDMEALPGFLVELHDSLRVVVARGRGGD